MWRPLKEKLPAITLIGVFILITACKVYAQPTISKITPNPVCQGDSITITGNNFTGATSVTLGTTDVLGFVIRDDKTIDALVDKSAKSGSVSVTTPKGTATLSITVNPAPQPNLSD